MNSLREDLFLQGFLAGVLGGIVMCIVDGLLFLGGITELLYLDWAAVIIFGFRASTMAETLFALLGKLLFAGYLGIVLNYLFPTLTKGHYRLKGIIIGSFAWLAINALTVLFQIAPLIPTDVATASSEFLTSTLFGLVFVEALHRLKWGTHETPVLRSLNEV